MKDQNDRPRADPHATDRKWWQERTYPAFGQEWSGASIDWFRSVAVERAFNGGAPVQNGGGLVYLSKDRENALDALFADLRSATGVRLIEHGYGSTFFAAPSVAMLVRGAPGESYRFHYVCNDLNVEKKIRDVFANHDAGPPPPEPECGPVHVLVQGMTGYSTTQIGTAGFPLERGNYGENVMRDYDHVVTDLTSVSPCGRLVIFSGEPGTGKTFLVRSLLAAVEDATFLLVPPHLVSRLGDPEMIGVLSETRNGDGPLIILAEDADQCLVPREQDGGHVSLDSIQAVLNLGDGILGNVLNVRVVITTNAPQMKMDRAAVRPGRLCKHVHVDALTGAEARSVLGRLVGPEKAEGMFAHTGATLAVVYAQARALGWAP